MIYLVRVGPASNKIWSGSSNRTRRMVSPLVGRTVTRYAVFFMRCASMLATTRCLPPPVLLLLCSVTSACYRRNYS